MKKFEYLYETERFIDLFIIIVLSENCLKRLFQQFVTLVNVIVILEQSN